MDEQKKPSHALREEIAAGLIGSGSRVRGIVVNQLTEKEIEERAAAVLSIYSKVQEKEKELRRAESEGKPAGFNLRGDVIGEPIYSKEQLESIKKLKEQIEKMQGALEKAFANDDFSKVKELSKQ